MRSRSDNSRTNDKREIHNNSILFLFRTQTNLKPSLPKFSSLSSSLSIPTIPSNVEKRRRPCSDHGEADPQTISFLLGLWLRRHHRLLSCQGLSRGPHDSYVRVVDPRGRRPLHPLATHRPSAIHSKPSSNPKYSNINTHPSALSNLSHL